MRKIIVVITILSSLHLITHAQLIIDDIINWQPVQSYPIQNGKKIEKFYYLSFPGVTYNDAYFLPYYTKVIDIPANTSAKATFIQTSFVKYSETHKLKANDIIPPDIKLTTQIFPARGKNKLIIQIIPVKKVNNSIYLLKSFKLKITFSPDTLKTKSTKRFVQNSVMASGHWVKIAIPATGVYRIHYDSLKAMGFQDPSRVRVFGNDFGQLPYFNYQYAPDDLVENAIMHKNNYIYFFAKGANVWYYDSTAQMFLLKEHDYSDTAYYFLSDVNTGFDNTIKTSQEPSTYTTTTDYYDWYDFRGYALHNYLKSGRQWFDVDFAYNTSKTFSFKAEYILQQQAKLKVVFMGRGYLTTYLTITAGDQSTTINIPPITGIHGTDFGKIVSNYMEFIPNDNDKININLQYNGIQSSSRGALDNITINAKRKLVYQGQLLFRNLDITGLNNTTKFTLYQTPEDIIIWDITTPTRPTMITSNYDNGQTWFIAQTDTLREFIAFAPEDALSPVTQGKFLGPIANQNLHVISANTQMLIISYPDFIAGAEKIAQIHRQYDNITVQVVSTEQVYNEFSSGIADAVAIRNFIRSLYLKPQSQLKWVLLFGDGSYKNKPDKNNPNFIPTYQTLNSLNTNGILTIVSDDFFGLLDENEGETQGLLDVNIGRIPVQTAQQAELISYKIEQYIYNQAKSFWKTNLTVVADDGEKNLFMDQLENVTNIMTNLYPQLLTKKIYIDAYPAQVLYAGEEYPQAVSEIANSVEQGTLILAYNGHGNEQVLTSERVITSSDVRSWHNMDRLTLMVTATCLFGHFDNYDNSLKEDRPSGVEYGIFNPKGGLIAAYTTARESYTITNYYMLNYFFQNIFSIQNGKKLTISEAITKTKELYPSYYNREFLLIGDPALTLTFPSKSIDSLYITPDTIKALSKVTVNGYITDNNGNPRKDFNGTITFKIFDKPQYYYTLNNDGAGAFKYLDYKNIIYSGEVSVINGSFNISFITPKDIDYQYGTGKVIYYATNGDDEFIGYKYITIGGQKDTILNDKQGPEIKIFLNDTTLANPTITDRNPKIIVHLKDETGINTTDYGLGHQIQLILDNNMYYNLNEYFIYDKNKSNQGKIEYKLYKLSPGKHTVTIKAYDVLNNYSEKTIEFIVTDQNNLVINRTFNYPNPFTTNTIFYFEHNQIDRNMYVSLQIFTVSGQLVKQFSQNMTCTSYLSEPIYWDGRDEYGKLIGKGVYIYVLTVRLQSGETVQKIGKLLKI